ncbi:MAG: TetR/AcrR family transcriptional regulator [Chlorobi bacterium]|nr:TetR/AcrR family transcriptional regulator [Chlorobiota bacterium]
MESIEDKKLLNILIAAKELFWKYGIKRVTVEEICREAKVSKMTFYKFFSNKKKLAEAIIDKVVGKSLKEFRELVESDKTFQEKIQQMLVMKLEGTKDISLEFINDLYKNKDLGLHLKMEEIGKESMQIFIDFLEDSKKKKLIRKEVRIEFILAYTNSVTQMMENPELLKVYEKPEDLIMESLNFLFYGILPINEQSN